MGANYGHAQRLRVLQSTARLCRMIGSQGSALTVRGAQS